jgi:hypothetical protein
MLQNITSPKILHVMKNKLRKEKDLPRAGKWLGQNWN